METTFETLPKVVGEIITRLDSIEMLLQKNSANQDELPTFLSVAEAANFLSLSVPTIYGLVQRADIPVNKKGKRLYFSKPELIEWVKSGRKKTNLEVSQEPLLPLKRKRRKL
jgi:excisionase family DNA binding protein